MRCMEQAMTGPAEIGGWRGTALEVCTEERCQGGIMHAVVLPRVSLSSDEDGEEREEKKDSSGATSYGPIRWAAGVGDMVCWPELVMAKDAKHSMFPLACCGALSCLSLADCESCPCSQRHTTSRLKSPLRDS